MEVNPESRTLLAAYCRRARPNSLPQRFERISEKHPTAHVTWPEGLHGPAHSVVCGTGIYPAFSIPAVDGTRLCDRCARWLRRRSPTLTSLSPAPST